MDMTKKKEYTPFKKHFWIPFILALTIILLGVIMTLTNQSDLAYFKGRGANRQNFVMTGPSVIIFGAIIATLLFYLRKFFK